MKSDPEQERQRLTRVYAAMSPEELQKVADEGASLAHAARETLKAEVSGRGLDITLNEAATGVDVIEERDLVMIRRFQNLPEALLAKGSLDSSGIECFLTDDNMVPPFWMNPRRSCWMWKVLESISNLDVLSVTAWRSTSNN
jgi:hypothetical protein